MPLPETKHRKQQDAIFTESYSEHNCTEASLLALSRLPESFQHQNSLMANKFKVKFTPAKKACTNRELREFTPEREQPQGLCIAYIQCK